MHTMVEPNQGGLGLSKMPSFAIIGDLLAEKIGLDHHGIGKSMLEFDR